MDLAQPEVVVHLAAISHVPTAAADPALAWDVNVTSTARLLHHLQRLRDAGRVDPTVLLVGSAEQYGRHDDTDIPLSETAQLEPRTVYAATKAAQEATGAAGVAVHRAPRHRVAQLQSHRTRTGAALRAARAGRTRRRAARRAAAARRCRSGIRSPIRDFLHVSDVVAAYISLCRQGTPGEAYNVASGTGLVGRDAGGAGARACAASMRRWPTDPALARPVDVPVLIGDPSKLQDATGWRATQSIDDIIDDLLTCRDALTCTAFS